MKKKEFTPIVKRLISDLPMDTKFYLSDLFINPQAHLGKHLFELYEEGEINNIKLINKNQKNKSCLWQRV